MLDDKPNDRLIIIGNPIVLEEIYKRIQREKDSSQNHLEKTYILY